MDSNKNHITQEIMNNNSIFQKSSMLTYSKVACCICGCQMEATLSAMCETCFKNQVDISEDICKEAILNYCKLCDRYLRNNSNWIVCELESSDLMSLCLSKIKGLNKNIKIVDSSFIWTEPHSKRKKIKLTIQKEVMNRIIVQKSFVVDFVEEWIQCDECKKSFTPHHWVASCQVRQNVGNKQTFLLLEQIVIKHHMQTKTVGVKEYPEGIDFYFSSVSHASILKDFIVKYFPCRVKSSKQLISHDQYSNTYNYKYCFSIEIAPVCKDEILVINNKISKELGGVGPILLCYRISSNVHLIDINTLCTFQFDEHTYWKYNFKSMVDRRCLQEFLIINVQEDIDYKNYQKNNINSTMNSNKNYDSKSSSIMNSRYSINRDRNDFKIVEVQCIRNNQVSDGKMELISVKSHLGEKMRPGDIFLGYDLTSGNYNYEIDEILNKSKSYPDIVLVRKKIVKKSKKRIWKIKRLIIDEGEALSKETKGKQLKKQEMDDQQYEQFLEDIEQDKDLRSKMNLYKVEDELINDKNKDLNEENKKDDSDADIKVSELLDELKFTEEELLSSSNQEKVEEDLFEEDPPKVEIQKKSKEPIIDFNKKRKKK